MKNYSLGSVLIILVATVIIITGNEFGRKPPLYPRDCLLKASVGSIADAPSVKRWFFYETAEGLQTCLEFHYSGGGGNPNNFMSYAECQETCMWINHCLMDQPDEGNEPCLGHVKRWFYNKETSSCEEFLYDGCRRNLNNFRSGLECAEKCMRRTKGRNGEFDRKPLNPTEIEITPLNPREIEITPLKPREFDRKPLNPREFDRNNWNPREFDRKPMYPRDCLLKAGRGSIADAPSVKRWFFYTMAEGYQTCLEFQYSGGGGNPNNFMSYEECQETCMWINQCLMDQPDEGNEPCLGYVKRWFYNQTSSRCEQFLYDGCRRNLNNFRSGLECVEKCMRRTTSRSGGDLEIGSGEFSEPGILSIQAIWKPFQAISKPFKKVPRI